MSIYRVKQYAKRFVVTAILLVFFNLSLLPQIPGKIGVVNAIDKCNKIAVDKGSILTDNDACIDPCQPNTASSAPQSTPTTQPDSGTDTTNEPKATTNIDLSSNSAQELATQMLASDNVSYWKNSSGIDTKDVVQALADGNKAYTTASNAPNKEADININILKFILEVAQEHPIMVNALTDKSHTSANSNHYKGQAVDLDNNGNNSPPTSVLDPIAEKYGGARNNETDHWHYDFTSGGAASPTSVTEGSTPVAGQCCPTSGGGTYNVPTLGSSQGIYKSGLNPPYIVEQFIEHTLKAIAQKTNKPVEDVATQEHIVALIAFAGAEGGGVKGNQGQFNLFNTKLNDPDLGGSTYSTDNGRDDETMNYPTFDQGIEATARTMVSNKYQSRLIAVLTQKNTTAEQFMETLTYYDRYPGNLAWAAASDPKAGGNPVKYLQTQLSLVKSVRDNYAARAGTPLNGSSGTLPTPKGSGGTATTAAGSGVSTCPNNTDSSGSGTSGDTRDVKCAIGSEEIDGGDEAVGYKDGNPHNIRVCAIPTIRSVDGRLKAKVNSTASQNFVDLANAAQAAGKNLVFNGEYSTFRSMDQQEYLCYKDGNGVEHKGVKNDSCEKGFTATPGESNHQMGFAIDFNFDGYSTGSDKMNGRCKTAKSNNELCRLDESSTWKWMSDNASTYGIKQLWYEYWHWGTEETGTPPS